MNERVKIGRNATGLEIHDAIMKAAKAVQEDGLGVVIKDEKYRYEPGSVKQALDSFRARIGRKVKVKERKHKRTGFLWLKKSVVEILRG